MVFEYLNSNGWFLILSSGIILIGIILKNWKLLLASSLLLVCVGILRVSGYFYISSYLFIFTALFLTVFPYLIKINPSKTKIRPPLGRLLFVFSLLLFTWFYIFDLKTINILNPTPLFVPKPESWSDSGGVYIIEASILLVSCAAAISIINIIGRAKDK